MKLSNNKNKDNILKIRMKIGLAFLESQQALLKVAYSINRHFWGIDFHIALTIPLTKGTKKFNLMLYSINGRALIQNKQNLCQKFESYARRHLRF